MVAKMTYLYIETDGEVYLVKKNGVLTFPEEGEKLPFKIKEIFTNSFPEGEVKFCFPILDKHPTSWIHKDKIPVMDNIEKVVLRSINFSLPRVICEIIITNKEGKILMTKNSRGMVKGIWKIPGGFVRYGENPTNTMPRELKEELGVEIENTKIVGIYKKLAKYPYHDMTCIMYHGKLKSDGFKINKDEISEIKWMPIDEAIKKAGISFNKLGLKDFKKSRGGSIP